MKVILHTMGSARMLNFYQAVLALAEHCELIVVSNERVLYAGDAEPSDTISKYHLSLARGMKPDRIPKIRDFPTTPGCAFNRSADKNLSRKYGHAFDAFQQRLPINNHFPSRPKF